MHNKKSYWHLLSKIWSFMSDGERSKWENFWDSLNAIAYHMTNGAKYLLESINPEKSTLDTFNYDYDLTVSVEGAVKTRIDPTVEFSDVNIQVLEIIVEIPETVDGEVIRMDSIVIQDNVYDAIHKEIDGQYLVISMNNTDAKHFKVHSVRVEDNLKIVRVIGDLVPYERKKIKAWFTTGLSFKIPSNTISVDSLTTAPGEHEVYSLGTHYSINNDILRFNVDVYNDFDSGTILYCKKSDTINENIFNMYGNIVGLDSWVNKNYTNISARSTVAGAMLGSQSSYQDEGYNLALNAMYNMPIAYDDGVVECLAESYGYTVKTSNGNVIGIDTVSDVSKLICANSYVMSSSGKIFKVSLVDRANGLLTLSGSVPVESKLYAVLDNKIEVEKTDSGFIYLNVDVSVQMNHIIDMFKEANYDIEGGVKYYTKFPEVNIYGSNIVSGVYHIVSASSTSTGCKLEVYTLANTPSKDGVIHYNDLLDDAASFRDTFLHIQWPTHKMLVVKYNGTKHVHYMDSTIDTRHSSGDTVNKYEILTRNVRAVSKGQFPGWFSYDVFRLVNGMDGEASLVELTGVIDGAVPGLYLPTDYKASPQYFSFDMFYSIYQDKFINTGSTVKSISNDEEFDISSSAHNIDNFISQSNVVFRLRAQSSAVHPESDKPATLYKSYKMSIDQTGKTILIEKTGDTDDMFLSNAYRDGRYLFTYDNAKGILNVYTNNTYDKGLSGRVNVVNSIRYSQNHILSE